MANGNNGPLQDTREHPPTAVIEVPEGGHVDPTAG
jgi:hypothetical protein